MTTKMLCGKEVQYDVESYFVTITANFNGDVVEMLITTNGLSFEVNGSFDKVGSKHSIAITKWLMLVWQTHLCKREWEAEAYSPYHDKVYAKLGFKKVDERTLQYQP